MGYAPAGALFVRKSADETVTSSNALQDDDELKVPLKANATYEFELCAFFDGAATGDLKTAFTVPAGATILWRPIMPTSAAASSPATMVGSVVGTSGGAANASGAVGAATKMPFGARGIVVMGGTAGNLQFQFSQATSDVTATTIFAGSFLKASQVG